MTDKELVERLRLNANCMMDEWEPTLCKRSEFITAADRIEQLCYVKKRLQGLDVKLYVIDVRGADWRETHDTGRTTISNSRLF